MNKDKFTPVDIDAEFDDVEFDEKFINKSTASFKKAQDPLFTSKLSKSNKGKTRTEQTKINISLGLKGKKKSKEHCEAMKIGAKTRPPKNQKSIDKWKQSRKGYKHSDEYKIKMKTLKQGYKPPESALEKMRETKRNQCRPILLDFGLFRSRPEAIEFYNQKRNTKYGKDNISYKMKNNPQANRYVTLEEYEQLKNQNINFIIL